MIFRVNRVDNDKEVNLNLLQIVDFADGSTDGTCSIQMTTGVIHNVKTTARKVRTQFRRLGGDTTPEREEAEAPVAPAPAPAPIAEEAASYIAPTPEPAVENTPAPVEAPLVQAVEVYNDAPPVAPATDYVGYNEPA